MSECSKLRFFMDRCQNAYFLSIFYKHYKTRGYANFATLQVRSERSYTKNKGIAVLLCINELSRSGAWIRRLPCLSREVRAFLPIKKRQSDRFDNKFGLQIIQKPAADLCGFPIAVIIALNEPFLYS